MKTALLLIVATTIGVAQSGRVPTVTRTVKQFGDMERQLLAAPDPESRGSWLSEDFEERLCSNPGTPIAKADWIVHPQDRGQLTQEAVHDYGDVAIYSAMQSGSAGSQMLVDTWIRNGNTWKLAVRYRCPASGARPASQDLPKRY